jgi:hypothetical protein
MNTDPLSEEDLAAIRELGESYLCKNHYEGCHRDHYHCAIIRLVREVARMRTELSDAHAEIYRLKEGPGW